MQWLSITASFCVNNLSSEERPIAFIHSHKVTKAFLRMSSATLPHWQRFSEHIRSVLISIYCEEPPISLPGIIFKMHSKISLKLPRKYHFSHWCCFSSLNASRCNLLIEYWCTPQRNANCHKMCCLITCPSYSTVTTTTTAKNACKKLRCAWPQWCSGACTSAFNLCNHQVQFACITKWYAEAEAHVQYLYSTYYSI